MLHKKKSQAQITAICYENTRHKFFVIENDPIDTPNDFLPSLPV